MKTKLEQITTAAELVTYTLAFGVPTDPESICKMQDIIGHSTQGELEALAEKYKEHDRNGKQFYFILYHIWSWEDATKFFMEHSSLTIERFQDQIEELEEKNAFYEKENKKLTTLYESEKGSRKDLAGSLEKAIDSYNMLEKKADQLEQKIIMQNQEILELKAKLYDLMTKTA